MPEARPTPSPSTEADLWRRWSERRDPVARDELVQTYLPMARAMAARYAGVSEPYDDLVQVACLGLVNAVARFDPVLGTPFAAFAKPTIMGELKRYFRDRAWTIRVPRSIHDAIAKVESATEELSLKSQRAPSVDELATHLKIEPSDVLEALEAAGNRSPMSLDAPLISDDGGESSVPEWVGTEEGGYELVEDRLMLEEILPGLGRDERVMLKLRFVDELPQSEIAERLGCSQMHVSRMLRRTLEQLRRQGRAGIDQAPAEVG